MSTTTSYGSWSGRVGRLSPSPDSDVLEHVGGGSHDWLKSLETSGALARMQADYRAAIESALPPSISLCGDEFIGPAEPDEGEFDGYPTDEYGVLDFAAMIEGIDLQKIVERHDPDCQ